MANQQLQDAVKDCQTGRVDSFGTVYDQLVGKIYNFLYYRTHHRQTAEDLTSLTFTKALANIRSYDEREGSIQTWLYRIARNSMIDHFRTFKPTQDISDAWEASTADNHEKDLDLRNKLAEVEQYLTLLSAEQRDLVIMRVWDDLTYREIAEVTGKSEASLKMSMSRIMTKLRSKVAAAVMALIFLT